MSIEGLAAINFQLSDPKDPIEVGAESAYEIRVTNQGTKAASNVRLAALRAAGHETAVGRRPGALQDRRPAGAVRAPQATRTQGRYAFTIKVKAEEVGDLRVQVQMATDEIRDPISKEESTRVYGDE